MSKNKIGKSDLRIVMILLFVLASSCSSPAPSALEKITHLNLNTIDGNVKTYYSNGYETRARKILELLHQSLKFFEDNFNIRQSFTLAVIDSSNWGQITSIPYGLPFVSGPPYVVCIPANSDNVLSGIVAEAIDQYGLNAHYGMTKEEIVSLFVSLIGFHELGHIYTNEFGISFPNRWTFEFAATYFAYFYLEQNFPVQGGIWIDVSKILEKELNPHYTSLNDFERMYVRVGVENYAWYQVVFLLRVREVYMEQGIGFLEKLKGHQWPSASESEYLNDMESISPGFITWAQKNQLQNFDSH
jgi:hypothetical protein